MSEERYYTVNEIYAILPKRLKFFREQSGLTLREAAKMIDKSPAQLSLWERGANPPTCIDLFKLCLIYNVSTVDLFQKTCKSIRPNVQELELIKKYRKADKEVKITIQRILDYSIKKG